MQLAEPHRNNFGLLRLLFAFCVLVSHSFELIDGDRSREPLTRLFGTISLGELGVDGFFLVSGYLIAKSFESSSSIASYLRKRVLRIYPGFMVAYAICIVVVAPLAGANMAGLRGTGWVKQLGHALTLAPPYLAEAFSDLPYPKLNGSMWTIGYEFRCYLLICVLGPLGVLRNAKILIPIVLILLVASELLSLPAIPFGSPTDLFGQPSATLRFTAIFLTGTGFYALRNRIAYQEKAAVIVAAVWFFALFNKQAEEVLTPLLGGYLIFWFASLEDTPRLNRVNDEKNDLSYGLYLYAWPVQNLAIMYIPGITPMLLIGLTTVIAGAGAWLSWHIVERPSLSFK